MSATTVPAPVTADAFYRFASRTRARMELVRGEVRTFPYCSAVHGVVSGRVLARLSACGRAEGDGWVVGGSAGFHPPIAGDVTDTVRAADAAFVRRARMPVLPHGFAHLAPDLAVEVLEPADTASDLMERMEDHFAAGTQLFWIVDPRRRRVAVHAPNAPMRLLREHDTLEGALVLPGLTIPVAALFQGMPDEPVRRPDGPPGAAAADTARDG